MPAPDPALIDALAAAIRSTAGFPGPIAAEWSQAGSAHAGRIYRETGALPLPDDVVALFARLREQMLTDEDGAWLSARIGVPARGAPSFDANYERRPWWNSPTTSMIDPGLDRDIAGPGGWGAPSPRPTDAEWLGELTLHPRPLTHWPEWLPRQPAEDEYIRLRSALDRAGVPRGAARLPGEAHAYFEGAVIIRPIDRVMATVELTDYGQAVRIGDGTPARVCRLAWEYLSTPLPGPWDLPAAEARARGATATAAFEDLAARVRGAGPGGIVTNLAPGLLFDRIGTLDGLYFFGWLTPLPWRSLPPTATSAGAARIVFLARSEAPVQAEIAPAWFGQPGGALRFRVLDEHATVRDLVTGGVLVPVRIPDAPPQWR